MFFCIKLNISINVTVYKTVYNNSFSSLSGNDSFNQWKGYENSVISVNSCIKNKIWYRRDNFFWEFFCHLGNIFFTPPTIIYIMIHYLHNFLSKNSSAWNLALSESFSVQKFWFMLFYNKICQIK